jgi:glycosyltransferase involved in cell wall biosynthesis
MRILMLLENEFLRDSRVEKEVETLYKSNHEVIVAAISKSGLPFIEKRENCIIFRKRISKFILKSGVGALKFPFYFNFWRKYLKGILSNHEFDAIHVHDLPLCRIGTEIKKKYNIKLVIDLHENWPALLSVSSHTNTLIGKILSSERQWRTYEAVCVRDADHIITVVDEMKKRISELGIPADKISVLENTPEPGSVNELKYERDEKFFTLVYIGGISYHRGLQYVVDGINLLVPRLPVRLWIAGDGKYSATLKEQVKKQSLQKYICFFGMITKTATEELMKKADIGLIPHIRSEQSDNSSPNKLFDYMAEGLPVLASDCISVKRVIEETNAGTTYIFDSPPDFANTVKTLYNHREKLAMFASNGKKAIDDKYNWEQGSDSLVTLYSNLNN